MTERAKHSVVLRAEHRQSKFPHRHLKIDAQQPTHDNETTETLNNNDEQQTITTTTSHTEQSATSNCESPTIDNWNTTLHSCIEGVRINMDVQNCTYSLCNTSTRTRRGHRQCRSYIFNDITIFFYSSQTSSTKKIIRQRQFYLTIDN